MKLMLVAGLLLLALAAVPGRLLAQTPAFRPIAPSQEALVAAGRLRLTSGQPLGLQPAAGALMVQRARGNQRQGEILMIVGAAGIVTGLLVKEDVVTIAGAAVGGFGLYQYLKATR